MNLRAGRIATLMVMMCLGCEPGTPALNERAQTAEVYEAVLERIREHMRLDAPLVLNPSLARVNTLIALNEGGLYIPPDVNSTLLPALISKSGGFTLCQRTSSGFCVGNLAGTTITLSEIRDFGDRGLAVIALMTAKRNRAYVEVNYLFQVRRGWRGARVVSVLPVT